MSTQNSGGLAFIRRTLYQLKRQYGQKLIINYRLTGTTYNPETMVKTVTQASFKVERAILLPSNVERSFVYSLPMIASNKNFTYGGNFVVGQRKLIIDAKDIPAGIELTNDMWVVFDGKRYELMEIHEFEFSAAFMLLVKQATNVQLDNLVQKTVYSPLDLTQTATAVVV